MVAKFSEKGGKEGFQISLLYQKSMHNTALCVEKYVHEVNLSTFLDRATQIHGGTSGKMG